jgi:aromatic-L-amino-acid decarboxylase
MADYLDQVEERPVKAQVRPGEIADRLPPTPPLHPESMDRILEDFRSVVLPGMTHWQHPSFFAYFQANSSRPSVLAEMLTATLAAQCMIWETSPAATELEGRMMEWLRQMIGLPEGFVGSIQDTASTATLCALLAARERLTEFQVNEEGLSGAGVLTVYCSEEAHSSVEKSVKIAGIGRANLCKIPVDDEFSMRADELDRAIEADVAAGRRPLLVTATVGTTGVSGFDPLREIGAVCHKHRVWLHVDAAWAGNALVLPETRWMIDGVELVDSFVFNPHKWRVLYP